MTALTNQLAEFFFALEHFRRKRTFADARRVRAHDAEHTGDVFRRETGAHTSAAHSCARRSDERVRPMIDVEQSCLRAFQQNCAPRRGCLIQKMARVSNKRRETFNKKG